MIVANNFIFGKQYLPANTFIGGVASTIGTASLLASKIGINVNRISVFKVIGNDIECRINGSYAITFNAFVNTTLTRYIDNENLVTNIAGGGFAIITSIFELNFNGIINLVSSFMLELSPNCKVVSLPNCVSINVQALWSGKPDIYYLPNVLTYGLSESSGLANVFDGNSTARIIYANPDKQTSNAGSENASLAYMRSRGTVIRYVASFIAPNNINDLSVNAIYTTAVKLNFTPPTGSTNAIEYYELWVNGQNTYKRIQLGEFITELTPSTNYTIELKPVDIFYNKSSSNIVNVTTSNTNYTDTDANAYISAANLTGLQQESSYVMITELKANNLWNQIQALYLFKGTIADQHKWNARNPLDTNSAFRINWFGGGSFSNLGFTGNGTNAYGNTNFVPSANQNVNSNGMTIVSGTNNNTIASETVEIGSANSNNQASYLAIKTTNTNGKSLVGFNQNINRISANSLDARGVFTGFRDGVNSTKLYKNKTLIATSTASGTLPTLPVWIGILNNGFNYGPTTQRIQIAIIHNGLTDAQVIKLHEIIDLSESIAGRKTW